jgi:hypothetical protein
LLPRDAELAGHALQVLPGGDDRRQITRAYLTSII